MRHKKEIKLNKGIKKIIKRKVKSYCTSLGIEPCQIKWNTNKTWYKQRICFSYDRADRTDYYIELNIDKLLDIVKINNNEYLWNIYPLKSISSRLNFILGHETGHYFHYNKYPKWSDMMVKEQKRIPRQTRLERNKYYRKQRKEQVADKIAFYLMNKQIKKRKSQNCPKCCKEDGCFQTWEKRTLGHGAWTGFVWVLHCKTLDRIHRKVLKGR